MEAGSFFRLKPEEMIRLPAGSRLFMLPDRRPVGYEPGTDKFITLEDGFATSAFISAGHTVTYNNAYKELRNLKPLPLFSYAACAVYKGEIYVTAMKIDDDKRHDCTLIDLAEVRSNVRKFKKLFPQNRLVRHLESCALVYGCPNAQNFFLKRYEAPLPTSPSCNSGCAGCISYQKKKRFPESQPRIKFTPTPEELAEVALFHIKHATDAIVSFGQGCEGEPLLQGEILEKTIKLIRRKTSRGTININTNGSKISVLERLFAAGLDSLRVSMNSVRQDFYNKYYKPRGYGLSDVMSSIDLAKRNNIFVSINYLTMPGFTDSKPEFAAFKNFAGRSKIDMVQWRNLNFDPMMYFEILKMRPKPGDLVGVRAVIESLRKEFPDLRMGYFNPRATASQHLRRRGL